VGSERTWRLLLPLSLAALAATLVFRPPQLAQSLWYTVQGLALVPVFICAVRFPRWRALEWLNAPVVAFVGTLSFSLYLLHFPVIFAVRGLLPNLPWGVCAAISLPLAIALSLLVWALVERPCARLRRRLALV
jgi:peptidoglycan/LPS O-acetylase OafA/YrhL